MQRHYSRFKKTWRHAASLKGMSGGRCHNGKLCLLGFKAGQAERLRDMMAINAAFDRMPELLYVFNLLLVWELIIFNFYALNPDTS